MHAILPGRWCSPAAPHQLTVPSRTTTAAPAGSASHLPALSGGSAGSLAAVEQPSILVSKVLTYSDVSTEVARTGRIVLPRIQVQQCLPELLRLCRAEHALPAVRNGGPVKLSVDLVSHPAGRGRASCNLQAASRQLREAIAVAGMCSMHACMRRRRTRHIDRCPQDACLACMHECPHLVAACLPAHPPAPRHVRHSSLQVVDDEAGRTWTILMKTWQNVVSGEHRPTFVLENTGACCSAGCWIANLLLLRRRRPSRPQWRQSLATLPLPTACSPHPLNPTCLFLPAADFVRANRLCQGDTLAFCPSSGRMLLRTSLRADQLLPKQAKRGSNAAAAARRRAAAAKPVAAPWELPAQPLASRKRKAELLSAADGWAAAGGCCYSPAEAAQALLDMHCSASPVSSQSEQLPLGHTHCSDVEDAAGPKRAAKRAASPPTPPAGAAVQHPIYRPTPMPAAALLAQQQQQPATGMPVPAAFRPQSTLQALAASQPCAAAAELPAVLPLSGAAQPAAASGLPASALAQAHAWLAAVLAQQQQERQWVEQYNRLLLLQALQQEQEQQQRMMAAATVQP